MEMSAGFVLPLMLYFATAISVLGQHQTGYISIDCGASVNFNYVDMDTGISYTSDEAYIDTGINMNISSEHAYPNNPTLPIPLSDLRSFPQGNKNCYTLIPSARNVSLNLIRATFLYGNYDGENKLPEFDLYLDVNFWSSIKFSSASDVFITEIISVAESDAIDICLVNKGFGTPFISALELRPLNSSIYGTEFGTSAALVLFERLDIGYINGSGRYSADIYDRIWSPYNSSSWDIVSTSSLINSNENGYQAPFEVIRTASRPRNDSEPLELYWTTTGPNSQFYVYLYFAEVEQLEKNQTRKFNISWNGSPMSGPFIPRYLYAAMISNSRALEGQEHRISIYKTEDSSRPPILNAAEIYIVKHLETSPTFRQDVDAIKDIRTTYRINKSWAGDPCEPSNYSWEGLKCNYNDSLPPRIISLNLSSSSLSGIITASIVKLSSLEFLDLSNNSLSGPLPGFLEELKYLKFLNLRGNNLSGSVSTALKERSKAGTLTLSADDWNLCSSGSCKNKKNVIIPVVASVSSALVLSVVLIILWKLQRKRKLAKEAERRLIEPKNRQFTYAEVLDITGNFKTVIGKGGFGTVYHGVMNSGNQVAVKVLSPSSSQGPKEFQTEAELLMRVHHRNLASFIGYCEDGKNMALIYEYMVNGNLKDYLSASHTLSWEMRLHIAIDAAQGLEYLHYGCKPPIIHRDVKTANILLGENLDAKLADFGLSKAITSDSHSHVITSVMGTTGYLDPEYYNTRKLTEKSDVYSFGVVLLELITGRPAIIKSDERIHIIEWVSPLIEREDIRSIVDQRLQGDFDLNSVWKALEVAMACTTPTSIHRATMSNVLTELKQSLAMEMSRDGKTSQESRENISIVTSYTSSEVFSMNSESMTAPSAR